MAASARCSRMTISIEPVLQFGDFTSPLRNIRARLDEYRLVLDLVPSRTLPDSVKVDPGLSDALKLIIGGGHEIVEDRKSGVEGKRGDLGGRRIIKKRN